MNSTSKSLRPMVVFVIVTLVLSLLIVGMVSAKNSMDDTSVSKVTREDGNAPKVKDVLFDPSDDIVDLDEIQTFIVQLQDPPLALYAGGIKGLAPTHAGTLGEAKLDANSAASQAYMNYLADQQKNVIDAMDALLGRTTKIEYQYKASLNGYAVELTSAEALLVGNMPEVRFIEPEGEFELHTDAGPTWLGAPSIWNGSSIGVPGTMGEGIIVGVIDTGIDPWNPSFLDVGDDGYDHTNPWGAGTYVGVCDSSNPLYDSTFPCNDKLIGAWGYSSVNNGDPRDANGHGSHTASTAAGNFVYDATISTPTAVYTADISGVAPHANIIAYAACCSGAALTAAKDQVVIDGVDVVNYSIGSSAPTPDPWRSADAIQWLAAREAGIHVANSAGNSGPGDETTHGPSDLPWITAIGASSHNRAFKTTLVMTNSNPLSPTIEINGWAMTSGLDTPTDIVFAADYAGGGIDPEDARLCADGVFPPGTFNGEIVVCERGSYGRVAKGQTVADGGAGGYILAQPDELGGGPGALAPDPHVLPASHIDYYEYQKLIDAHANGYTMGTITGAVMDTSVSNGDIMASFSSRGANQAVPDLIVPSVTAPGRAIWAAYHQGPNDGDYTFNVIQGTSMSSPHVAGAMALMKALHPTWTPAEVQSALMMTARNNVLNDDGINVATPFAQGSGHVNLAIAPNVGFVLDVTRAEYEAADPSLGGEPKDLNTASMGNTNCVGTCSWTRTVRSVLSTDAAYTVTVDAPPNIAVTVSPMTFTLGAGATQEIVVTADVSAASLDDWLFAWVNFEGPDVNNLIEFSGTIVGSPDSWDRPWEVGDGTSGSCPISSFGPVNYVLHEFSVGVTGNYDIGSEQDYDGFIHVYENAFDPADQCVGLIALDDDGNGSTGTSNINDLLLSSTNTYYLVTSAFSNGDEGVFTNTISGPGAITVVGEGSSTVFSLIPDTHMPIAVKPSSSNLPETLNINAQYRSGSVDLADLLSVEITDLTVDVTGLIKSERTAMSVNEADTSMGFPDAFFTSDAAYHEITATVDTFSVIAEIVDTTSPDLDLLLFYDANDNGIPELSDAGAPDTNPLTCQSASGGSFEFCEILNPAPGRYFVAVINYESSVPGQPDDLDLSSLALPSDMDMDNMTVTGPASVAGGVPYTLTVNYDEPDLVVGDIMYGAFDVGSDPGNPGNIGTTRVFFTYVGVPVIEVTPPSIVETVPVSTSVAETIVVSNNGEGDLIWNMNETVSTTELLNDGGFELGRVGIWTTTHNLAPFLPICTTDCPISGLNYAHTGDWWAWFGGSSANPVLATASQSVVIPSGTAMLEYWIFIAPGNLGDATMTVSLDGNVLATYTEADETSGYVRVQIDISAYADGGSHTLLFDYQKTVTGPDTDVTMFVDDVSIVSLGGSCNPVLMIPWLSMVPQSGVTAGGSSVDVVATFDATGLAPGVYTDTVCLGSNDPASPITNVDVTMVVVDTLYSYFPIMMKP
ncbi:MAG: hypothetical protein CSB13_09245 [Chloroflexi bacterium]|nr:MAG: hypothetical protein CSB13_09245 [Chloroflexota bacterium]